MRSLPALLLLAALAAPAAALGYDHDVADPADDVVAWRGNASAPVARPGLDLLRVTVRQEGPEVVEVARFAAPLEENATVTFHNQLAEPESHALAITYAKTLPPGERGSAVATRPREAPSAVAVVVAERGDELEARFRADALPGWAVCFEPAVVVGVLERDGEVRVEDLLDHDHAGCGARTPFPALGLLALAAAAALARR